jgi:hypothetical protein
MGKKPFYFDIQQFAINGNGGNGFPPNVQQVIEQLGFLERLLRDSLEPTLVLRPRDIKAEDWFDARIGETKTFTSSALITPNTTPLNPANNTGLDNGMTADVRAFEQWVATLNEWPGFIPTNILGQEAFIADLYIDNMEKLAQKSGNSLELITVNRAFQAYDSGDTFVKTAVAGTSASIEVDNLSGFLTQFSTTALPSYPAPTAVSSTNKMPVAFIDAATGLIKDLANVVAGTPDATNGSYMQTGSQTFGTSGIASLDAAIGPLNIGDRMVAIDAGQFASLAVGAPLDPRKKDGSYVVRPTNANNVMITTAEAMAITNVMNPSVMLPYAVSILKRRGIPKLPNGLYGCAIDSTLLASFYGDQGFQRATATNWDRGRYFKDGVIAAGWGIEFTEATQLPAYNAPAGGFALRHAFVFGKDVIAEHPFRGAKDAANIVARVGDVADERWVNRIKFRSLAAIDTLGQVIKCAYDYVGDFVPRTDKASQPPIVLSSDWQRYKRGVILQAASPY